MGLNTLKYATTLLLIASCADSSPKNKEDASIPASDAAIDMEDAGGNAVEDASVPEDAGQTHAPFGPYVYDYYESGGCALYLELRVDQVYVAALACVNGDVREVFMEAGTYYDNEQDHVLVLTQLASTCPEWPAEEQITSYGLNPYRLFLNSELPMEELDFLLIPEPYKLGCWQDVFVETPLTCFDADNCPEGQAP